MFVDFLDYYYIVLVVGNKQSPPPPPLSCRRKKEKINNNNIVEQKTHKGTTIRHLIYCHNRANSHANKHYHSCHKL